MTSPPSYEPPPTNDPTLLVSCPETHHLPPSPITSPPITSEPIPIMSDGHYHRPPRPHSRPSHRDDYRPRSQSPIPRRRSASRDHYYEREADRSRDRDRDRDDRLRRDDRRDDRFERRRRTDYYDHDYDRHYDRDYRREREDDDNRSWRKREQTEPNNYIILQGLPKPAEEHDIQQTLESLDASIENVRLIRDRKTGVSRCFAFVKFTSVEHARQFMDKRYPYIMMNDHRVRIDYSHNSGTGDDEAWTCRNCAVLNYKKRPTCFQCNISMQESVPIPAIPSAYHHSPTASPSAPTPGGADYGINDGGRDVGSTPHHILLVRGLDNLTTGEGVHATFGAVSPAVRRTLLVKDRMSRMSWGFAFVEYPDVQSASHVLSILTSQQARRQDRAGAPRRRPTPGMADFIVDDRPVIVSFAHPNSLAPVYVPSEWTVMGDGGSVLAYWDEQAYPCEFIAPPGGEAGGKGEEGKKEEEKGSEKRTVDGGKIIAPAPASASVDDELSAFYADVGATIFSGGGEEPESIFAVPKK